MNKQILSIAALSSLTLTAVGFGIASLGCGKSSSSGGSALATINGEEISMDDFHKYLETKPSVRVTVNNGVANADVAGTLAFQGLEDMIRRQVLFQLAKKEGVFPTEQDIAKELDFQRKLDPDLLTKATASGMTIDEVKQRLLLGLARERIITKGVTVTLADADDYIRANPKEFTDPAKVQLLVILVKASDKKTKVDDALRAGQTFSVVAAQYSDQPNAREMGGRYMTPKGETAWPITSLPNDIVRKAIVATPEGKATEWISFTDGSAKFFIEKKTAEKAQELNNYKKEFVRRVLAQRRGAQAIDLDARIDKMLVDSKIDVKQKGLSDLWKRAFDRYKDQQKTGASTAAPTSTKTP